MKLNSLQLKNFRNYSDLYLDLSPGINIFIGNNAQGKSNILESIFVLALTKSYMNIKDSYLIKDGKDFTMIRSNFFSGTIENKLEIIIANNSKKIRVNNYEVKKYNEYISKIKVLIFSPYNVNFIKDGPNVRRKDINMVISQYSNNYVKLLQNYNAILKKRNQFLKSVESFNEHNNFYFKTLNERFSIIACDIIIERASFVSKINKHISHIYRELMNYDDLEFRYNTNVGVIGDRSIMLDKFREQLSRIFERERAYGMTLIGPHRDDFSFFLGDKDLSIYGSQGQIRAAILALKLAELIIFKEKDGDYPILLLDDIFSELDIEKRNRLVKYILDDVQTIITTTDVEMLDDSLLERAKVFVVNNGQITEDGKKECKYE